MLHLLAKLPVQSEFRTNVYKLVGGTAVAQLILVLVSPLLSRLYAPADFGTFALYTSITSVLLGVSAFRYELGVVIARSRTEALHLLALSFLFLFLACLLSLVLILGFRETIVRYLYLQEFPAAVLLIPFTALCSGAYQILSQWANRTKAFKSIAVARVAQNATNAFSTLLLGLVRLVGAGLLVGHAVGALLGMVLMLRRNLPTLQEARHHLTSRRLWHTLVKFRDFPLYSLPTAFLDVVSFTLPVFLITSFFSAELTGQYSLAFRILNLPLTLVGAAVGQVFFQKLSETYHRRGDCRSLVTRTWVWLFLLGLGPMLIVFFFAPELFRLVFGPEWVEAGQIAAIMAVPQFFAFCSSPTSGAFAVYRIQKISFIFGLLVISLRPLAFYLGYLQSDLFLSLQLWALVDIALVIAYNIIVYQRSPAEVQVAEKALV